MDLPRPFSKTPFPLYYRHLCGRYNYYIEINASAYKAFLLTQTPFLWIPDSQRLHIESGIPKIIIGFDSIHSLTHKKDKYDLEDCVNDYLIYYNNKKHSTTGVLDPKVSKAGCQEETTMYIVIPHSLESRTALVVFHSRLMTLTLLSSTPFPILTQFFTCYCPTMYRDTWDLSIPIICLPFD